MPLVAEQIQALVSAELEKITHPQVRTLLSQLLVPQLTSSRRKWDQGEDEHPCWTVAEHKPSDVALVYSHLSGKKAPWSAVPCKKKWFGIDHAWFVTLEQAFCESPAAASLKIWSLCTRSEAGSGQAVACDLTLDEALTECLKRNNAAGKPAFVVERTRQ